MGKLAFADREHRQNLDDQKPGRPGSPGEPKDPPKPAVPRRRKPRRRPRPSGFSQNRWLKDQSTRWSELIAKLSRRRVLAFILGGLLTACLLAVYATVFLVVANVKPAENPDSKIDLLIVLFGAAVVVLVASIVWIIGRFFIGKRRDRPGSRLSADFIIQFGVIAMLPITLSAALAGALFVGIEFWFSDRTQRVLENSEHVAASYLAEQRADIGHHMTVWAEYLDNSAQTFVDNPAAFQADLQRGARMLNLLGVYLVTSDNLVRATGFEQPEQSPFNPLPEAAFAAADQAPLVTPNVDKTQILALVRLNNFENTYLYAARRINDRIPALVNETGQALTEYREAEASKERLTQLYVLTFVGIALSVFLVAMFLALRLSKRIAEPLSDLVDAASVISHGDLSARVQVRPGDDEIATLGHTFNQMTADLETQRDELVEANRQFDQRRRFMEAVLSGVTAGVIGLDSKGCVTLMNRSAHTLLGVSEEELMGQDIRDAVPPLEPLVRAATVSEEPLMQADVDVEVHGITRNLIVRVTSEPSVDEAKGYVVTFDDVTDLVSAQRMSAWADVARRIAHEIKNPLTPIQLSAERLRRKYRKEISSQPEIFEQCTDTIIRQVGDIGRMVDEFSSFARMPEAVMRTDDIGDLVRQATFLQRVGNPDIEFVLDLPKNVKTVECDGRQISQAMINVLKNAVEAVATRVANDGANGQPGRIAVQVVVEDGQVVITVTDNGVGLPKDDRHRLTEPYMTTRSKGTGLGLAIVKKIMEDHGGSVRLSDAVREGKPCGAVIRMSFPARRAGRVAKPVDSKVSGAVA